MIEQWVRNVDDQLRYRQPWVKARIVSRQEIVVPTDENDFCKELKNTLLETGERLWADRSSSWMAISNPQRSPQIRPMVVT
jgi:hypothetical protein